MIWQLLFGSVLAAAFCTYFEVVEVVVDEVIVVVLFYYDNMIATHFIEQVCKKIIFVAK